MTRKIYRNLRSAPKIEVGDVYGRLTVLRRGNLVRVKDGVKKTWGAWDCSCTCGNFTNVMDQSLRSGRTESCGCLATEASTARVLRTGHCSDGGQSKTYMAWRDMLQRCRNPKNPSFHNYGGRGITVCERWSDFSNFLSDMGEAPEGLTLDRSRVNEGYSKGNCTWSSWDVQALNKRSGGTQLITHNGESLAPSAWAKKLGVCVETIRGRRQKGLTVAEILYVGNLRNERVA